MILIENASTPIDSHDGEAATRACADVMAPVPEAGNEVENEPALAESVMQHGAPNEERERGSSSMDFTPTPDRPVPAQKAATRRPLSFQFMEFGLIHSEHSLVRKIRNELGLRLRVLPTTIISESGLMELALQSPLHVTLEDGKFYCIGGLNFFRLMRCSLPGTFVIPIIVHEGYNPKKLRSHILFDLFLTPVLSSVDMNDRRLMGAIWTKLQDEEVFSRTLEVESSDALSALLNCDRRTAGAAPRVAGKTSMTTGKAPVESVSSKSE